MWLVIFLILTLVFLLVYLDIKKPENFPPGPTWLPIIGSALVVDKFRQKYKTLSTSFFQLSQIYGPILGLKIGTDVQVILNDYEIIRQVLTEEVFDGRPTGPFFTERTFGKRRGILFTDQGFWQEQRRFVIRQLREFGFGKKDMGETIAEEAQELVNTTIHKLDSNNTVIISINNFFNISAINTLWTMLVGCRYDTQNEDFKKLQLDLGEFFKNIDLVGSLFGQFPYLKYLAPEKSGYNFYIKMHKPIWKFLQNAIDQHKENFKPDESKDFVDKYLEELKYSNAKSNFSELQLMAICLDLFMAGSETTSRTLEFAMLFLVLNLDVQKKAHDEIEQVIGKERIPLLSDRVNMPYIEAIVLESLRHISGRSLAVPHRALRDTTIEGYFIPKDTMIVPNMCSIMMNPTYFYEPQEFRPERFMKDGKIHLLEQCIVFGAGKRKCLGETLGKASVFLFITSLLQKFEFTPVPGEPQPVLEILDGITPTPKPFRVLATLR